MNRSGQAVFTNFRRSSLFVKFSAQPLNKQISDDVRIYTSPRCLHSRRRLRRECPRRRDTQSSGPHLSLLLQRNPWDNDQLWCRTQRHASCYSNHWRDLLRPKIERLLSTIISTSYIPSSLISLYRYNHQPRCRLGRDRLPGKLQPRHSLWLAYR
jgi:hypothetical protein